ncbi:lysophospholipid acyltransferase family protein [Thermostichus vulcanus]|uniref:1-acyl-sn-glycerol-3-phosphate acyltransferase n=1 Tax=Thermostichus vulcanus str. 'Rupite' TaxID=2813851 RepID=A0ABT0CAU9_THEVL|nr:lysophospholipid acyltransferase family protein [Thermostichus vulcanus]MCJ2542914.1 1-acyl-sn-glycerol-3-phosphate acyltransferase [Thermostichus vulcanus str. 'Rupite']
MASQTGYRHLDWLAYWLLKWLVVNPLFRGLYLGHTYGQDRVPRQGSLIIVSNHASHLDPPLLSNAVRRPVAFMAKEELFRVPVLKQAIRLYGAYPVKRGGSDRSALRATETALAQGWAVGIFLNGTRTPDGRIPHPHLGAALIAARTQTPLLPVALWGTEKVLPKGSKWPQLFCPITVRIGELIPPPASSDKGELQQVTARCVTAIHMLLDQGR